MVTKAKKAQTIEDLKLALLKATLTVVSDYQGTTVAELTQLRRDVQKAGGDLTIAKNTLIKVAVGDKISALDKFLTGPTAVAYTNGDPVPVAKAITDYIAKVKKTTVKGGVLDGKLVTESELKAIASLPSREVLLSKLLGSMNSPAQGMVYALSGVAKNLVCVLEAVRKQKEA